jgi:heme exporter protein A
MDLIAENLICARAGLPVLEGVSFRLSSGQALILRGPNGVGKTTLLRVVAGLQPAMGGTLQVPESGVAYAGHADGVKATLTVAENLSFWADVYRHDGVPAAIAALNLGTLADRPAGSLSAGQRRRLGLARLMVTGRAIWVLDEPTVSLDAASISLFVAMVTAHLANGGSALIATHVDLGLAGTHDLDLTAFRARPMQGRAA